MASTLPRLPVFEAIASHDPKSSAVIHSQSGRRFTYGELLGDVADAKAKLGMAASGTDMQGQRVAFLVENSYDYVGATLSAAHFSKYINLPQSLCYLSSAASQLHSPYPMAFRCRS